MQNWVAVKELKLTNHNSKTLFVTISPYHGHLTQKIRSHINMRSLEVGSFHTTPARASRSPPGPSGSHMGALWETSCSGL